MTRKTTFCQLMSVGLAWNSAAKINEKLVNQKYAKLFLSWMPFWLFCSLQCSASFSTFSKRQHMSEVTRDLDFKDGFGKYMRVKFRLLVLVISKDQLKKHQLYLWVCTFMNELDLLYHFELSIHYNEKSENI